MTNNIVQKKMTVTLSSTKENQILVGHQLQKQLTENADPSTYDNFTLGDYSFTGAYVINVDFDNDISIDVRYTEVNNKES